MKPLTKTFYCGRIAVFCSVFLHCSQYSVFVCIIAKKICVEFGIAIKSHSAFKSHNTPRIHSTHNTMCWMQKTAVTNIQKPAQFCWISYIVSTLGNERIVLPNYCSHLFLNLYCLMCYVCGDWYLQLRMQRITGIHFASLMEMDMQ